MQQRAVPFVRVGVFYDGSFFSSVSDFHLYQHTRHSRLSIDGLHEFIRETLAEREQVPVERCRIVEAHYVRGRMSARDAADRDRLLAERQWDETLLRLGVTPYYLPLATLPNDRFEEKGVDVWFALEAYERARDGRFDVAVLIACDGDYTPLVRKLQRAGVRVMVVGCDCNGLRTTRTSRRLLAEATYPILLNDIVDDPARADDPRVLRLFMPRREGYVPAAQEAELAPPSGNGAPPVTATPSDGEAGLVDSVHPYQDDSGESAGNALVSIDDEDEAMAAPMLTQQRMHGIIWKLKEGFGFAKVEGLPRDVFFHQSALTDRPFNRLREGEEATLMVTETPRGYIASQVFPASPSPFGSAYVSGVRPMRKTPAASQTPVSPAISDDEGYPL